MIYSYSLEKISSVLQRIIQNTLKDGCHIYTIVLFFFHLKQHFHSGIYLLSYPLLIKEHPPFTFHFKWLVASRFSPHYLHKALCLTAHVKVEKRKHLSFEKSKYCKNKGIKHGFYFSTDSDSIVQLSFVT